jgi:Domain of unknown function (DUF1844)
MTAEEADSHDSSTISFPAFILSLAHTAAVHFGDIPDPVTGQPSQLNLQAAQQMIDILSLLEQILYELRMRYLEAVKSGGPGSSEPRIIIP